MTMTDTPIFDAVVRELVAKGRELPAVVARHWNPVSESKTTTEPVELPKAEGVAPTPSEPPQRRKTKARQRQPRPGPPPPPPKAEPDGSIVIRTHGHTLVESEKQPGVLECTTCTYTKVID